MSESDTASTKAVLDGLTQAFFRAFDNRNGRRPDLASLHDLFIAQAMIVKNSGAAPEICTLAQFIEPREQLLSDGCLIDFFEVELRERTEIFGRIAQRFCLYRKSGTLRGQAFETRGMKTLQFLETSAGWKISSVAWDDEREGLAIPSDWDRASE